MDDMCVYSRSILDRLNAITNGFQNAASNNQQSESTYVIKKMEIQPELSY